MLSTNINEENIKFSITTARSGKNKAAYIAPGHVEAEESKKWFAWAIYNTLKNHLFDKISIPDLFFNENTNSCAFLQINKCRSLKDIFQNLVIQQEGWKKELENIEIEQIELMKKQENWPLLEKDQERYLNLWQQGIKLHASLKESSEKLQQLKKEYSSAFLQYSFFCDLIGFQDKNCEFFGIDDYNNAWIIKVNNAFENVNDQANEETNILPVVVDLFNQLKKELSFVNEQQIKDLLEISNIEQILFDSLNSTKEFLLKKISDEPESQTIQDEFKKALIYIETRLNEFKASYQTKDISRSSDILPEEKSGNNVPNERVFGSTKSSKKIPYNSQQGYLTEGTSISVITQYLAFSLVHELKRHLDNCQINIANSCINMNEEKFISYKIEPIVFEKIGQEAFVKKELERIKWEKAELKNDKENPEQYALLQVEESSLRQSLQESLQKLAILGKEHSITFLHYIVFRYLIGDSDKKINFFGLDTSDNFWLVNFKYPFKSNRNNSINQQISEILDNFSKDLAQQLLYFENINLLQNILQNLSEYEDEILDTLGKAANFLKEKCVLEADQQTISYESSIAIGYVKNQLAKIKTMEKEGGILVIHGNSTGNVSNLTDVFKTPPNKPEKRSYSEISVSPIGKGDTPSKKENKENNNPNVSSEPKSKRRLFGPYSP